MQAESGIFCHVIVCILFSIIRVLPSTTVGRLQNSDTVTSRGSNKTQLALPQDNVNQSHSPMLLMHNLPDLSTAEFGVDYRVDPTGNSCSNEDIVIMQGPSAPLPSGIPTYTVDIMNVCVSGCSICNIHVSCGWFSSARLIDPSVFKRLWYDDCLVNGGDPLLSGETVYFQYANSFEYPLSVSSVICC